MNKKELNIIKRKNWYKYHIPSCGNLMRVKKNAVFLSAANSYAHEMKKAEICYFLKKKGHEFITEAERNRKRGESRVKVDIIDLDDGMEYEIETTKSRAKGLIEDEKNRDVTVIKLWDIQKYDNIEYPNLDKMSIGEWNKEIEKFSVLKWNLKPEEKKILKQSQDIIKSMVRSAKRNDSPVMISLGD